MSHAHKPSVDSEMHELNVEADFLDQKTTIVPAGANGEDTKLQSHNNDPDAQAMVIESLRAQVQDLFSQVSQLNNKLVRSYDRVSDLEDELHVTSANLRQATLKISQLELERTQHLSALSTGLLVEKSHVTAELNRLMEKATEEAARRGQAETARAEIEQELDDLSAGLFNQANTMVAEARMAEARSARKLEETEAALRGAEEVVGALQAQMQALQAEKEQADRRVEEMRARMGKGKWVERSPDGNRAHRPRLMVTHVPYHEFLVFISHLRTIRPLSAQPPAMSGLLPLPFLARLVAEDSDPTVRLDLAPSLNWLSRRSVLAAIHSGQLTVEPMPFATLLEELAPPNIPSHSHNTQIVCALCGMPIYSSSDSQASTPTTPNSSRIGSQSASWSTSLFKNVRAGDLSLPNAFTGHNRHSAQLMPANAEPPSQVYIFRLEATSSGLPVSLPLSSQQPGTPTKQSTIYPLCTTGWCLARLRTTCSLWAFVRTSVVEKIWEEPPFTERLASGKAAPNGLGSAEKKHDGLNGVVASTSASESKPALPPRRSKIGLGSLWGTMQRSLSGAREPEKEPAKPKEAETRPRLPPRDPSRKGLPPAPPVHPAISAHAPAKPAGTVHAVPPPLPKRNRERDGKGASRAGTPEPAHGAAQQASPALSRNESHDSFTTPTEELAPAFSASPAPTTVPLPPSQAPTPEPQESERPPRPSQRPKDDKPPSRTASPIPPPLPRRAAARGRPSSMISAQQPEAQSPPKENGDGAAPSEGPAPTSVPSDDTAQPSENAPVSEEPERLPATAAAAEKATTETSTLAEQQREEDKSDVQTQVIRDAPSETAMATVTPDGGSVAEEETVAGAEAETETTESTKEDEKERDDGARYVGDATWEERTYKELVRLREEMFWARIGAVSH
ncbi:hypothetical protein PYCCODRAFT_1398201 [Trametes coccinea BRFM310]|uniref:GDP/GTP exchange factor Sec2 N-terminal domain-containing protein n=1 Tax=Trametes coccinea (strain BRFM310) TaxID=1353009 RepID=A0A1Y2IBH3_TRAC3|nr:hypothetical protein PYCCODRAFT_1398201 [Trametes coccinea BRFM310]